MCLRCIEEVPSGTGPETCKELTGAMDVDNFAAEIMAASGFLDPIPWEDHHPVSTLTHLLCRYLVCLGTDAMANQLQSEIVYLAKSS